MPKKTFFASYTIPARPGLLEISSQIIFLFQAKARTLILPTGVDAGIPQQKFARCVHIEVLKCEFTCESLL